MAGTAGLWAFDRDDDWIKRYPSCNKNATRISPINIDYNELSLCSTLCRLSVKYEPTTCSISMINNIPTVTFTPNCLLKFQNNFFYLRKMTIHYTSMHTVNNGYSDMEILLYHNSNPINDSDGGVILSILLKKGNDYSPASLFLNEFINRMPSNEMPVEQDIDVSSTWCPDQLFPESKSFFYYDGALPYPPCDPKWTFIIFEEVNTVSLNIIDTVKYMIGAGNKNIRPIQRTPRTTTIYYNANSQFDGAQDVSDDAVAAALTPDITAQAINSNLLGSTSWLKQNIYYIKGIIIGIILLLMVYIAIRFAQIIVSKDLLNSFIINQLKKKQKREYDDAQKQMANQQAAEYGGVAPVEAPENNGNGNGGNGGNGNANGNGGNGNNNN